MTKFLVQGFGEGRSDDEIIALALANHHECGFALVRNGLTVFFGLTRVVCLWRTPECFDAGEDPLYEISFARKG